ncbi:MAG: nitroreductase/quinone reductase family protein [Egibacteraceae bacterium]
MPGVVLLETIGRRSGEPRRTPVANGLNGDVFWVLAERGSGAQYVRNLQADPHVRVKVRGRWRSGLAQVLPNEDPQRIARLMPAKVTATAARLLATDLTVIRIDLG